MGFNQMQGRKAKAIWFPSGESVNSYRGVQGHKDRTLVLESVYHGDHDQIWIIEKRGDEEISRHNVRHIESIIWEE